MSLRRKLPLLIVAIVSVGLALHGPIPQFANYHAFADTRGLLGVPNAFDVFSNLAFLFVGVWGWWRLGSLRKHSAINASWPGYALFVLALLATAIGSACYHWAPDDARLVWDRLPIALACAGLMAGAQADASGRSAWPFTIGLALAAAFSVGWWSHSGDLRLYLLMQTLPLVLVPLWQYQGGSSRSERLWFGAALLVYGAARATELRDAQLLEALGGALSGHTLKHLLAAVAAMLILRSVLARPGLARPAPAPAPAATAAAS